MQHTINTLSYHLTRTLKHSGLSFCTFGTDPHPAPGPGSPDGFITPNVVMKLSLICRMFKALCFIPNLISEGYSWFLCDRVGTLAEHYE